MAMSSLKLIGESIDCAVEVVAWYQSGYMTLELDLMVEPVDVHHHLIDDLMLLVMVRMLVEQMYVYDTEMKTTTMNMTTAR
jgi:hypothetical protein